MTRLKTQTISALIAALAFTAAAMATAQNALMLEKITVTARKRTEHAQDVPIAINAVAGDLMSDNGINNLEDLSDSLPNVEISDSPSANKVVIRGLGSGSGNPAFEQSVGMYVDGIYAARASQFQAPFLDVERVEVLKGPQGVLFGKNSIAGAVSIISKTPTDQFEAELTGKYEFENEGYEVNGVLSGALSENLYGRLVAKTDQTGLYLDNAFRNQELPDTQSDSVRTTFVWEVTETTSLMLKLERSELDEKGQNWQVYADYTPGSLPFLLENRPVSDPELQAALAAGGQAAAIVASDQYTISRAGGENYTLDDTSYLNAPDFLDQSSQNATFQVSHALGKYDLAYLFGYTEYEREQLTDNDFSAVAALATTSFEDYTQVSHELRLASPGGETIQYVAGLYYLDREFDHKGVINLFEFATGGLVATARHSNNRVFEEDTESLAVFAQGTWNITHAFRATVGLRYSSEDKKARNDQVLYEFGTSEPLNPTSTRLISSAFQAPVFTEGDKRSESNLDPTVNLQWDFSDTGMVYASWTRATKAGGFNANEQNGIADNFSFEEEKAESWEVGFKTDLLNGRMRLNGAIFSTSFEDLQIASFDPRLNAFLVKNAAKANSEGIELESQYLVSESLTAGASVACLSAEYDEFTASCPSNGIEADKRDCVDDNGLLVQDLAEVQIETAPEVTASLFLDYSTPLGDKLFAGARLNANYKGETTLNFSQDSNLIEDAYWKLGLRLSLDSADQRWTAALLLSNLTNEKTSSLAGQAFSLRCVLGQPVGWPRG